MMVAGGVLGLLCTQPYLFILPTVISHNSLVSQSMERFRTADVTNKIPSTVSRYSISDFMDYFCKPTAAAELTYTLRGDDPLAPPLIMIWCAPKSGERDRAESIFVRLAADETKADDVPDRHAIDAAMAVALAMVRARRVP
jgi:hypothetical protein